MEIKEFKPKVTKSWTLPMQEVRILPIGDIQYGAQGCDVDRLQRHLEWGMERECYFIGMGDYLDVASPSNRQALREARLYDSVRDMMNDKMAEETDHLLNRVLLPTKGRWLGMVTGHHWWDFEDGTTTDTRLAEALDAPYMGDAAAMSLLRFEHEGKVGWGKIWFHHGQGYARTATGRLSRLMGIANTFFAHIYLMGHVPAKVHDRLPWIDTDVTRDGRIRWRGPTNRIVATTGGFMKSYALGTKDPFGRPTGDYAEKAMLPPAALGGILLFMRPRIRGGRVEIDLGYQDG